jgi:glycosyltransferase involved in cell wall biosynthesis
MPDLSILMPVFNERETVRGAVEQVLASSYPTDDIEVVVVDDGSTDGTADVLAELSEDPRVTLVSHERNAGKGAAVRTALEHATGRYAAIMDADLEYDPADIGKLLGPVVTGEADVVFGTRGFESHSAFSFWYVVGNKGVTLAANLLFNSYLRDIMTCHKVMRTDIFRSLRLESRGFDIEPEITGKLLASGHQIHEVPVRYQARGREEGKKLTTVDGLRVLHRLVKCRLSAGLRLPPRRRIQEPTTSESRHRDPASPKPLR